jgi:uncharacterized membrane protein YhdT
MSLCMIALIVTRKRGEGRYYFALWQTNNNTPNKLLLTILKSLLYFIRFVLVAFSARQRCSITKTRKWFKLLTLPLPISKCLQVSTMFASLTRYYFALWQTNNNTPNKLLLSESAVSCLLRVRSVSFTSRSKGCIKFVLLYFIRFVLVAFSARQRCSITKTRKWLKLLTLPLPISKCLQVSTMFASLTAGLIKNGFL